MGRIITEIRDPNKVPRKLAPFREVDVDQWDSIFSTEFQAETVDAIENGHILFLPNLSFPLLPNEQRFLTPDCIHPKYKNISFDSNTDSLQGVQCSPLEHADFKTMMARFAQSAQTLVQQLLPSYTIALQIGRTSFRPTEIANRQSSYRKDDSRLHVDAFPATPNQGKRILRVFTNVNPNGQARIWRVGESFEQIAKQFLPLVKKPLWGSARLLQMLRLIKSYRTAYDHIMLQIHDRMKGDPSYQKSGLQCEVHFPPHTSWIVQTDEVPHAAMSGQYVFEQTFYLPADAMVNPLRSPLRILEKLTGRSLV